MVCVHFLFSRLCPFSGEPIHAITFALPPQARQVSTSILNTCFHVKDAELNPTGRQGVCGGYQSWLDRAFDGFAGTDIDAGL